MSVYHISLVALTATTLLIVLLRPLAVVTGLVDIPNERKSHQIPTPLVGGLAIFAGLVVAFLLTVAGGESLPLREILSFFGGGLLLVTVGVVDDFFDLSPMARFVAQICAALLMIFGAGIVLQDLGGMTLSGQLLSNGGLGRSVHRLCHPGCDQCAEYVRWSGRIEWQSFAGLAGRIACCRLALG